MKVVFWSPHHGQTGTSTNLACTAICAALNHQYKVLIAHPQTENRVLESILMPAYKHHPTTRTLENHGLDAIIRLSKSDKLAQEHFSNYTYPLLKESRLDLLVGTENPDKHALEEIASETLVEIFNKASHCYDLVMLDLHSGLTQETTRQLLAGADLIVVSLNQNTLTHEAYLEMKKELDPRIPLVVSLGMYQKTLRHTAKNLSKKYGHKVVTTMPYYEALVDASNQGNLIALMAKLALGKKAWDKHPFLKPVKNQVDVIMAELSKVKGAM